MRGRGVDMGLGGKGVGRRGFGMKVRIKKTDGEGRRFQRGGGLHSGRVGYVGEQGSEY